VKVLLDANISHKVLAGLRTAGHDAIHVREIQMGSSPDPEILAAARQQSRVLITGDADFARLLALRRFTRGFIPSG
jgi:predicted nuclease of predicted toxin-antitoxin system